MGYTIYVVDASPAVHRLVEQASSTEGYEVSAFKDPASALDAARKRRPDLFIADYHLDGMTFTEFCEQLQATGALATASIIALVTFSDRLDDTQLEPLGVRALLKKPLQPDYLLQAIKVVKQQVEEGGAEPVTETAKSLGSGGTYRDGETSGSAGHSYLRMKEKKPAGDSGATPARSGTLAETVQSLVSQLSQSAGVEVQHVLERMVPELISRELPAQLEQAVALAVPKYLASAMPELKLDGLIEEAVDKRLSGLVAKHVADALPTLVRDLAASAVSAQLGDAVGKAMPDAITRHLSTIEQTVKNTVREAASEEARTAVQAAVKAAVDQAVKKVVPDLAEDAIKKEIARLTA